MGDDTDETLCTIDEVADLFGYQGASRTGSARKTLSRLGVTAVDREPGRGGKSRYRLTDVKAARAGMLGQGARTDRATGQEG
ncbi:hypothetical protein [Streptomyces sp. NPDC008150]|uniref:hypothetical protein n=1 Tax=Streptomyces sp. NPDC008150 TaxID=3364816 RepID=UPI0036EF6B89